MRLGIFAKTFVRPTLAETLDAVAACGLDCVQFNFSCAGLPSMPDEIAPGCCSPRLPASCGGAPFPSPAVSGTFNMIDPNLDQRRQGLRRLEGIAASCAGLGAPMVTLCTGTRDPADPWRAHPLNDSAGGLAGLAGFDGAGAAELPTRYNICLGVEPETANVINSAKKARQLLDRLRSPRLKIVMDPANLFRTGDGARMAEILKEAFGLLGPDIALAHAKDFRDGPPLNTVAAGRGMLDWPRCLELLRAAGYNGPLILHSLAEDEVPAAVAFLRRLSRQSGADPSAPVPAAFDHDGIRFHYQSEGARRPFLLPTRPGGGPDAALQLVPSAGGHPPSRF